MQEFLAFFHSLIKSLSERKFNESKPILINHLDQACDGVHRIGASLALEIPVKAKVGSGVFCPEMTAAKLRDYYRLEDKYLDLMAYEYTKLKQGTRMACLFSATNEMQDAVEKILKEHGKIVYAKDILLTSTGFWEFVDILGLSSAEGKRYFSESNRSETLVKAYLYECNNPEAIEEVQKQIEMLCPVSISKEPNKTREIAATIFNDNSLMFLNQKTEGNNEEFCFLFQNLKQFLPENHIDPDAICLDMGSVLAAFGLRDCGHLEILHRVSLPPNFREYKLDSHNTYLPYYPVKLDEILYNPECHFYFRGIKFVSPELLRKMMSNRNADNDRTDAKLIDSLNLRTSF